MAYANIEKKRANWRKWHMLKTHGITYEEYYTLLESQNGLCAICKQEENPKLNRRLAVDHDHETGQIRGLLCYSCNTALGKFKDNVDSLQAAIVYIKGNK